MSAWDMLPALADAAQMDGPERTVLALSQSQARLLLDMLKPGRSFNPPFNPCGHQRSVPDCGGCDPGAIEYEFGGVEISCPAGDPVPTCTREGAVCIFPKCYTPSAPAVKPPPDPSTETMLQAVDVLRVDADGVALPLTSPLLRAVADWLEMTADQIDQAAHEFSTVPYPRGHDRRAMKVALAALGEHGAECHAFGAARKTCQRLRIDLPDIPCPCDKGDGAP